MCAGEIERVVDIVEDGVVEFGAGREHVDLAGLHCLAPAPMVLEDVFERAAFGDGEAHDE